MKIILYVHLIELSKPYHDNLRKNTIPQAFYNHFP